MDDASRRLRRSVGDLFWLFLSSFYGQKHGGHPLVHLAVALGVYLFWPKPEKAVGCHSMVCE